MQRSSAEVINFYSARAEYGAFSNFYEAPILLHGKLFPTSEHYFQAMKFVGTEHEGAIRRLASPGQAAKAGRDRKKPLREDWEEVKDDVMLTAVRAKFTQHEDLKQILLGTGDAFLVEHTTRDRYWGDGGDGTGKNMLGKLLVQVREEIRTGTVPALEEDGPPLKRAALGRDGRLQEYEGDLLECPFTYIVHQCNCRTTNGKGLAASLFAAFPHANCYNGPAVTTRRPGEIQICTDGPRIVVNLFGQDHPGTPARKGHDSMQSRLHWFRQGLVALQNYIASAAVAETEQKVSVAFPYNIGCGLGGGRWDDYRAAIAEFADTCPPVVEAVYIVQLPGQGTA